MRYRGQNSESVISQHENTFRQGFHPVLQAIRGLPPRRAFFCLKIKTKGKVFVDTGPTKSKKVSNGSYTLGLLFAFFDFNIKRVSGKVVVMVSGGVDSSGTTGGDKAFDCGKSGDTLFINSSARRWPLRLG